MTPCLSRLVASGAVALVLSMGLVAGAPAASAHTVSGVGATNWHTVLTGFTPALPGLSLRVVDNGSQLEVVNHGPEVVVFGYDGEPYLRVGSEGVFINSKSPAAYLNCSRDGCPVPVIADATAAPVWEHISNQPVILWHDHRIHWMGQHLPPDVAAAPRVRHVEAQWSVTLARGSTTVTARGYYVWVPGPGAAPWLVLVVALAALAVGVAFSRSWRMLAVVVAVLAGIDLVHAGIVAWFWVGGTGFRVAQFLDGSSYQIPGWILAVAAVRLLWRHRSRGRSLAVAAAASAVIFTGIFDFTVLDRPYAPFAASIVLDRVCVASCLGLGLGVIVGVLALVRADRTPLGYKADDERQGELGGIAPGVGAGY